MAKICVIGSSKKYFSGLTTHTIFLANALAAENSVSVLTFRNLLPRFLYPARQNVGRHDFSMEFKPGIRVFEEMDWNSPLSWIKAYRFLKKEKPDVIIMAWWTSAVAHLELLIALFNTTRIKAALILEMHEIVDPLEASKAPLRIYSRLMGHQIMSRSRAFVVHSESVRQKAIEVYHLKDEQVSVIPIGLYDSYLTGFSREAARRALGLREDFVILNFGMIRKYKGVPVLVQAFNRLPPQIAARSRLLIVGENWGDEEGLEQIIRTSPYYSQITFHPEFVPDAMIANYFYAAEVVALPYQRTSGSAVANLAMAYGKPIVISDLAGIRETLQDYQGTFFVPQGDSTALAAAISRVYNQCQSGQMPTYPIPEKYSWANVARLFQALIAKIRISKKQNEK